MAERRMSTNHLAPNKLMSVSSNDQTVSLRLSHQPNFRSGQKATGTRGDNYHLVSQKSQKSFLGAAARGTAPGCTSTLRGGDISSKVGLKINSAR